MSTLTVPDIDFRPFPKIPRLNRAVWISEKLDGTNASVYITEAGDIFAGSRNRWITPDKDNYGFAAYVAQNRDELVELLGPGHHFGEWYGAGIQRRYDLDDKYFALFNADRWEHLRRDDRAVEINLEVVYSRVCGSMMEGYVEAGLMMDELSEFGSLHVPGFGAPEGIVLYHTASRQSYKWTFDYDEKGKNQ